MSHTEQQLLAALPDAAGLLDASGRFAVGNPALTAILGPAVMGQALHEALATLPEGVAPEAIVAEARVAGQSSGVVTKAGEPECGPLLLHAGRTGADCVLLTLRPVEVGRGLPTRGLAVVDAAGVVISHNRAFLTVLGRGGLGADALGADALGADALGAGAPLGGRVLSSLVAPADRGALSEALRTVRAGPGRTLAVRGQPQGPFVQLRLAWLAASEEFVVEAIAAAGPATVGDAGSLSALAAGIAHDFNNLLTVIQGNLREASELAKGATGGLSAGGPAPLIRNAERAVQSAAALSRQLMALGRARESAREAVAVGPLLADLESWLRGSIDERVSVDVSASPGLRVLSSRAELEQVLLNLTVNGAEAMPSGGRLQIVAEVEAEVEAPDVEAGAMGAGGLPARRDGYASIRVRDEGVGMDAATLSRALEPYFSTKGAGGNGLGLAMVQQIVREQGGALSLRSQPGKGTTVTVVLPLAGPKTIAATAEPSGPVAQLGEQGAGGRVLVVDDRAEIRMACAAILRKAGYAVEEAADGSAALARAAVWMPALVVLDAAMPGLSGPATFEALSRSAPGVRAVFISGFDAEALAGLEPSERWTFVPKPFDGETLLGAVANLLAACPSLPLSP